MRDCFSQTADALIELVFFSWVYKSVLSPISFLKALPNLLSLSVPKMPSSPHYLTTQKSVQRSIEVFRIAVYSEDYLTLDLFSSSQS